jgi:protein SCO1/2
VNTLVLATIVAAGALAQSPQSLPPALDRVGFDQRLDTLVPLDAAFLNETGRTVRLGELLGDKPAVFVLVQYRCPMLCNLILNGLVDVLEKLPFQLGEEFNVITVSFDAREQPSLAVAKKAAYVERLDRPGAEKGWHFLTGDATAIDRLTAAVGFRYNYDRVQDRFAHPSGLVVVTPQGKIARYFFGVEYSPRDLRLGLVEASQNKIGSAVDQVMLFCYGYDSATGKYTAAVMNMVRTGGVITVVAVIAFIVRNRSRQPRGFGNAAPSPPTPLPADGERGAETTTPLSPSAGRGVGGEGA